MRILDFGQEALQDVRYALRMMAGQPLFTAMATLSLALGIGANTAIYSFMDAILLRALPVPNPETLVVLNWHSKDSPPIVESHWGSVFKDPKTGHNSGDFPFAAYELFRAKNPVLSSVFAFKGIGRQNVLIRGQADLAATQYVSGEFFSGLSVPPAAGRLIDASDDIPGAPPVAVLSFGYAQRRFGEIASAVGQSIQINNKPFAVAGVAAPEFFGVNPEGPQDLYIPLHTDVLIETPVGGDVNSKYVDNRNYWIDLMGRLKPGVTIRQAQAALGPMFGRLVESTAVTPKERADLPALYLQEGAGGLDFLRRQYSKPLYVLMTMVALILAIACANTANLLLARSAARRREMAVRLSLGASRLRVVRQLLTESILLAAIGGLLGLAFAKWGIHALTLLIANGRADFTLRAGLNWHVLAVAMALSLATGILFGLAPAVQATRVDLLSRLKQTRAGEQSLRLHSWFRINLTQVLVVSQIAISLVLLVGAGLFLRTLTNLNSTALGFNSDHVLLFSVNPRQAGYDKEALVRFYESLQSRFSGIPGVRSVTSSNFPLVSGAAGTTGVKLSGFVGKNPGSSVLYVGPGFLTTMEIPILLGRQIDERDVRAGASVAVVNEEFAKTFFPKENPVGRHFLLGGAKGDDLEIVGVARNARYSSLKRDIPPVSYVPYSQSLKFTGQMTYELRAAGDPLALTETVERIVGQADRRIPVSNVVTQAKRIDQTISQERTFATLCTCFSVLALLIACVGLYGTMAYSVARRTNEIGIRMALGAERGRVIWMVLREVLAMGVVGLGLGLIAALATSRLIESFLFQMKPNDPLALALAAVTLLAATLVAGFGPASAASRVDPWTALRDE
jgi:macrolide transport system ATP-binding/permease protein